MPPDLPAHEAHPSLLASLGMCTGELPPPFLGTESAASTRTPSILVLPQPSCLHSPAANSSPSTVVDTPESTAVTAPAATKRKTKAQLKGKATEEAKSQVKRVKWTNNMYFASVLSQELGMVLNRDQVSLKYWKLKCAYRKEKREQKRTGNAARISEMDEGLWAILNDAFGGRDDDEGMEVDVAQATEEVSKQKPAPVAQLATALQGGMEAIASSLGARSSAEDQLRALTSAIQQQQEETRKFQEMQLQLLRELLAQRQ
ncbi:hypothetical protein GN958_ATG10887 [Phytophthora infestans]|uniref:Uncharacterized protein n=1 Tax=Phytophthora infestans TaxID=4787 RepID=A0A8S9UNF2_PHYIN|nr:hypothetical protein GN958_ATG10887 [Phytophthora infestans]